MTESIRALHRLGQSLWYDNIERKLLENGELKSLITRGEIRGITSNPTIFQNAITKTTDYTPALTPLAWAGWDAEMIFWQLAIEDIREACDLFQTLYQETGGADGFVSLEVNPNLAMDTEGTVKQAKELWRQVDRPNLMIKIPATKPGIPAIRQAIAAGINVNVTLIFSLQRYEEVMDAYVSGLEDRLALDLPLGSIASVASFFVSRVDSKIDPRLPKNSPLHGRAAIANAKLAYQAFESTFKSPRFELLRDQHGAAYQRPLWASTGTKNPAYSDTLYVDNLIGPNTVNTVPPATLSAFRDHGQPTLSLVQEVNLARAALDEIESQGISLEEVTMELEHEGVKAFSDAFAALIEAIEVQRKTAVDSIGNLSSVVSRRMFQLEVDSVPLKFWEKDAALWTQDLSAQAEIRSRLGWLDSPEDALRRRDAYSEFADMLHKEGVNRVLVIGMGGSSLTAEVLSSLMARAGLKAELSLAILDSTDPQQVAEALVDYPPGESLYVVASKSGGTAEMIAAFNCFWEQSGEDGSRFIAITDPGTSLEALAKERGFRKVFNADPNIGGRFSALTDFGLVPAALLGMDIDALLRSASRMKAQCVPQVPAARNPGFALGSLLAESALAGRDKLTIVCDPPLEPLAGWIEQIVAESSGKQGKGILPVPLEPLDAPEVYGEDRLFIYLRQTGDLENGVNGLRHAGFPVVELPVASPTDAGGEFFRWEMAVSVACLILGINAFDQPDVQDSKNRTNIKIDEYQQTGKISEVGLVPVREAGPDLVTLVEGLSSGDFVAVNAYLPRNQANIDNLQFLRVAIRERSKSAVTAGFGPRFQHSTGQFHKGGPNKGSFIQLVYSPVEDMGVPTQGISFGTLLRAQALGDYEALVAAGRRVLRILLAHPSDLEMLGKFLQ